MFNMNHCGDTGLCFWPLKVHEFVSNCRVFYNSKFSV